MDFSIKPIDAKTGMAAVKAGCIAVGVFEDKKLSRAARELDRKNAIGAALKSGDITGKPGSTLLLRGIDGVAAERVLLVGLGKDEALTEKNFLSAVQATARMFATLGANDGALALPFDDIKDRDTAWAVCSTVLAMRDASYRYDTTKSKKESEPNGVRKLAFLTSAASAAAAKQAVAQGTAIANGVALAKDLGNLPGNICHPPYLADIARALGEEFRFDVEVLERDDMKHLGMGAALAVGQASAHPCKFIVMHYRGGSTADAPIVLVGKGVTFDTGGISLKPGANMDEMKFDMCGAAAVLGAVKAAARLALPINLIGLIPAVENMPGGNATRPGDVVRSMSGQTIEILNTDAEGRLALADALTYAERFNPACVIDVATLTGACVIALGNVASGLLANDDQLADELLASGVDTGDRAWRLPMFDEYQDLLKSNFADMSNLGGRPAGTITAACFLSRFARKYPWAHLDIAGTNALSGDAKGATGRPVPLLAEFLINRAAATHPPVS